MQITEANCLRSTALHFVIYND